MPGTLLADDWQKAVEDQLRNTAQAAQRQLQVIADVPRQAVAAVQTVAPPPPDPNQVMQSLQSTAQNAFGGLQVLGGGVQQSAQDVNAQLQQTAQDTFGGLIPLQRPQAPVVTPPYPQAQPVTTQATALGAPSYPSVRLGQGQSDFVTSLQPLAARVSARTGIDPNVMLAIAANETGWGQSQTAQQQNNLFSIQGPSGRASRWASYASPEESFDAFVDLVSTAPRYRAAWAVRNDPDRFVDELRRAGYVADEPGYPAQGWVDQVKAINRNLPAAPQVTPGERAGGLIQQVNRPPFAGALPHNEEPGSSTDALGDKWKTQFGFKATYTGDYRTGTPHRGVDLVPQRGGIGTSVEAFAPGTVTLIQRDTGGAGGLMVYVRDADGLTHAYMHLAGTAPGLKVGDVVGRGQPIAQMGESGTEGSPHLHYEVRKNAASGDPLDQLIDPRPYMAGARGTGGEMVAAQAPGEPRRMGVIQLGDQTRPAARPPLYVGDLNVSELNERPGIQVVGDVFSGLGTAAQGAVQAAEPARRWLAGESQAEARAAGYSPEFQARARDIAAQPIQPPGPLDLAGTLIPGNPFYAPGRAPGLMTPVAPQDVAQKRVQINRAIEDSPVFQNWPVPVAAGVGIMATQILLDPATYVTAGPAMRAGQIVGQQVGEATGRQMLGRITASSVANGLQNAALELQKPNPDPLEVGTQFALGLGVGPAFDFAPAALVKVGRALVSRADDLVGRVPPDLVDLLRTRQRGELDLGLLTTGEPTLREAAPGVPEPTVPPQVEPPARRLAGRQRLPNYQPGTPEAEFEAIARPLRESSADGLLHLDLNTLPKDILPLDRDAAAGSGLVKANPGGMPHTDDLRALLEANEQKRDFYYDQSDQGIPTVGPNNLEEWFAVNAIMSQRTGVSTQVREAIDMMATVRKVAQDGRAVGKSPQEIRADILKAVNDFAYAGPSGPNKRIGANRGYATGVSETGGIKTPTFAGNYGSAESRLYDPGITNDIHNWRAMNVDSFGTGEKDAANNPTLYRTVEALFNELGAEQGMDGYAAQSAIWDGIRAMQNRTPGAWAKWQTGDFKGAIAEAKAAGAFNRMTQTAGAPEPGEISRAMNAPGVKAALAKWGSILKEPLPPELGIDSVVRTYPGEVSAKGIPKRGAASLRPASLPFREGERAVAEAAAPVVRGVTGDALERLGVDERGVMPWLATSHRVIEETPGSYVVHLPAGNADTARYVASEVGSALGVPETQIHVPDYRVSTMAGMAFVGDAAEVRALQAMLDADGHATIRGTTGRSLQIPLYDAATATRVVETLQRNSFDLTLLKEYNGTNERIESGSYPRHLAETRGRFEPTTAGRRDLLERARGVAAEEPAAGFTAPGGLRRARGEASVPFGINVGGAALGGYAGYAATPANSDWSEYARNIGLGATAGLLGTRAVTGRAAGRLAEAVAGRAEGVRAPERPTLEDQLAQARLREPTRPSAQPRTLGEVHSNPHLLREAAQGEAPLGDEDLMAHADQLEARLAEVRARAEAVDEQLRNPNQKPERPPWGAGYTNDQLIEIARKNGVSAYDEAWWDTAGLSSGSGEVREDIGQSGLRGTGQREPTPAELRVERNALAQEERDLTAAYDQLTTAPAGARFAPRAARGTELPFDAGAQEAAPHGPFAVEHAGPSGSLAEDIVTRNGTHKRPSGLKGLWTEPGQVVGEKAGIKGRGIVDVEAADIGAPDRVTRELMPNLDALLGEEMPEVHAQIQKAVEDNPELFAAYQQGRISHASLKDDLARKVGMTTKEWLKTPVGKGFTTPELVALQAAAVDAEHAATQMAREIMDRGGVDQLTPEEVAFGLSNLFDTTRLLAVARGGRSSAGRSLNALKIRMDTTLARGITASNERIAARRTADQARRAAVKATQLLDKTRDLEQEAKQAVNKAREANVPKNILDQIAEAYDQLDRYQAMSLHEKADDFAKLAKERADRAAARKTKVREAPAELLSALKAELAAERKIFAGRKDTWETMAFWDSKAGEKAAEKRQGFRAGLYLEQQRKAANAAVKANEEMARRAWEAESRRQTQQTEKASRLLEAIGGEKPSRELLKAFTEAIASDDPMVAAKFLKGLSRPQTGFGQVVEFARNANVLRLAGMLSATATHLVNAGGNVIQVPLELGTHAGTVGIDILRSALTGGERQAYAAELLPMIKSYGPGFLAALPNALRVLKTGITPAEVADLSKLRPGFRSGLPGRVGEVVDPTIEMPLRALQASDQLFRGGAFSMHAQRVAIRRATQEGFRGAQRSGRANNIVANLEDYPELYKEAFDAAARMVYQERRTVPGLSGIKPKGTAADVGELAVSQVVPFRTTPANIFAQGFGLSPAGLLGVAEAVGSRGGIAARVASGELPAERLGQQTLLGEQRLARAAIGTGILGAGLWLGSQKDEQGRSKAMLTAMYDENEASTYPQGWRAWSMRAENSQNGEMVYVPLQNFGAAGVPLAMAALLTDAERRGKKVWEGDELMRATTGLGRYALDNTFLQGVSDWVDLLHDPARSGGKFVEGLVASYGPYSGMGRQVQRAQGVASRNPREGWLGLLDALEANYPGVSGNVPEATTPLGEPRTPGATGFGALVGRYDIERDNPTLVALRAAGVKVPAETKTLAVGRGYGVELTEAERDQLKRARGDAIEAAVERERAKPRVAEWERTLQTAPPDSAAYKDALQRYNGALQATVSGAASAANIAFQKQLGRDQVQARMKLTREVEPSYIGPPAAPVGELAG